MEFWLIVGVTGCGDALVIGPEQTLGSDSGALDGPTSADASADATPTQLCPQGCPSPNVCWQSHVWVLAADGGPDLEIGDLYGRCTTNCMQDPAYAAQCDSLGGTCRHPIGADGGPDYAGGICEKP